MFAWFSWTAIFASSMNIVMNSSSSAMFGRMRLTATQPLEALDAERLGLEHLGHAADVDAIEQQVFSELDRLLQPTLAPTTMGTRSSILRTQTPNM